MWGQADLGHLYPLERAFFYVVKPPLLITHEEIDVVEFQRQGKDSLAVAKTFDFMIRTKVPSLPGNLPPLPFLHPQRISVLPEPACEEQILRLLSGLGLKSGRFDQYSFMLLLFACCIVYSALPSIAF